jgi:hypothetical protein
MSAQAGGSSLKIRVSVVRFRPWAPFFQQNHGLVGQSDILAHGGKTNRREARLEVLEGFLEQLALERKESVAKSVNDDFALDAGAGQEDFRRASAFLDSYRVLPGENDPLHFEVGVSPGKVQKRATGPISMSSQWAPRESRRFTRVKYRTDSIAAPRELLRRS